MGDQNPSNKRRGTIKQQDAQTLEMKEDRISNLPESLLIHILSLLPSTEEVIRTGTLSKRWLHLWTLVPNLRFIADLSSLDGLCERFVSIVNTTLAMSRVSKIEKFSIPLIPYLTSVGSDVDSWIHFLTEKNVDHLALGFINMNDDDDDDHDVYILPQHLYTTFSLKILELENCCFVNPVGLIGWKSLKNLWLKDVKLSIAVMEGILSGCPVLEILELRDYCGFNRLEVTSPSLRELVLSGFGYTSDDEDDDSDGDGGDAYLAISAPNLRSLTISSHFYTSNVRLEDVKSLVVADLSFDLAIHDAVERDMCCDLLQELIKKLDHVEELKLGNWCIQVLSVLEVKALPSPLLNCKSLTLSLGIVDNGLPGIAKLLDSSPNLETVVVIKEGRHSLKNFFHGCLFDAHSINKENYLQSRKTISEGLLLHLKSVKIYGFERASLEVERLQLLLKNAEVLEK